MAGAHGEKEKSGSFIVLILLLVSAGSFSPGKESVLWRGRAEENQTCVFVVETVTLECSVQDQLSWSHQTEPLLAHQHPAISNRKSKKINRNICVLRVATPLEKGDFRRLEFRSHSAMKHTFSQPLFFSQLCRIAVVRKESQNTYSRWSELEASRWVNTWCVFPICIFEIYS